MIIGPYYRLTHSCIAKLFFSYSLQITARVPLKFFSSVTMAGKCDRLGESPSVRTRVILAAKEVHSLAGEISSVAKRLSTVQKNLDEIVRLMNKWEKEDEEDGSDGAVPAAKRARHDDFIKEDDYVVVYTDGACENNGYQNAKAGIGVWFGPAHPLNISQPITGLPTNNRAEIHACIEAIRAAHKNGVQKLKIKTDSKFVISSMTQWIQNWKRNNWKTANKTDVKNKEDMIMLDNACQLLDLKWEHVKGHVGVHGNEEADKLAVAGAAKYKKN